MKLKSFFLRQIKDRITSNLILYVGVLLVLHIDAFSNRPRIVPIGPSRNTHYTLITRRMINGRERIKHSRLCAPSAIRTQEWCAQIEVESNESITDMTEGLPFFPLLCPCIGIRKLSAVVLSYEGQIETSPSPSRPP